MPASDFEYLAYNETPIGGIALRRRIAPSDPDTLITEITIDGLLLMSSHHTASEKALARCALERCPGEGLSVLVGGLGLGYTAWEVLKSSAVTRVDVVEYLPEVARWMRNGLVPLSDTLNSDPRFAIVEGDAYAMLLGEPGHLYDLVLVDVDHSPDEMLAASNAPFYTPAGLARVRAHLRPGGVLGVWSYADSPAFAAALGEVFARVEIEQIEFHNVLTREDETNWVFLGLCD